MRYLLGMLMMIVIVVFIKLFLHHSQLIKNKKTILSPVVEVIHAQSKNIQRYLIADGFIKSISSVDIMSDVPGKVNQVLFQSGQWVHAGETLIILDHAVISAEIEEANAKYIYQKRNFLRFLKLSQRGIIANDTLDHLKSERDQQAAKIHELYAELDKRIIRAPISGWVGLSNITVGQYIQTGEKIVNVRNDDSFVLDLMIPAKHIKNIFLNQSVGIETVGNRCGVVETIDTKIDNYTHGIPVRIRINHCHAPIISGEFVRAFLLYNSNRHIIFPATALHYSMRGSSIFVVKNNHVQQVPVDVLLDNDMAIVQSGNVHSGDVIVKGGQNKLFDNQNITMRESE